MEYIEALLICLAASALLYYSYWVSEWLNKNKKKVEIRFEDLKTNLSYPFEEYTTYSNNHPYVWGEVDFDETKKWLYESINAQHLRPSRLQFSLKYDDENRAIYIGVGTEDFDWSSLKHYEEWLESNSQVVENIRENRNRKDLN